MSTPRFYILAFVIAIFSLGACSPTRHLGPNEYLLYDLKLEGVRQNKESEMVALYQQVPNFRIPFTGIMPYLAIYNLGKQFYNPGRIDRKIVRTRLRFNNRIAKAQADSARVTRLRQRRENRLEHLYVRKEEGNILMRRLGEPPALYDSLETLATTDQLSIYLQSHGFFRSQVTARTQVRKKRVYLTYQVKEDHPFRYTEITYDIPDQAVYRKVLANQPSSLLRLQDRYDEQVLTQERDRLELLLRNSGYFDFSKRYITFEPDTSYAPYTVRLATLIANPTDTSDHTVYRIKDVYFVGDANQNRFGRTRDTTVLNRVHYVAYQQRFSPKVLDKKISVYPGQLYNQELTLQTQRQLTDLDMFRSNNVSYTRLGTDSLLGPALAAHVQVAPAPRYQETAEFGMNLTELRPGPFTNVRLRMRNIFRGAEVLDLGVRGGLEGQVSRVENRAIYTREVGVNAALIFPRFVMPILDDAYLAQFNPRTRVNTGYTYINRPEYTRTNLETSLDYLWQKKRQVLYSVSPLDISIVNTPSLDSVFRANLIRLQDQGIPLLQSFNRSFISTVNFSRIYNDNDINQTLNARYLRTFVELGGLSQMFLNYRVGNLEQFQFAKANVDYRRYLPRPNGTTFAYRANGGIASPIQFMQANSQVLPYDKYFFSGGGSSIRAWRPRRLGPGSYAPGFREDTGLRNYAQEQPGEILLELSAEYRFPIFSFFHGALFLDAGNVWTINEDRTRPGSKFTPQFYKEIAVGTGVGLRLDFTFLIFRLDVGVKVMDPAEPEGERFVLDNFKPRHLFYLGQNNQSAFNIGIGYPF